MMLEIFVANPLNNNAYLLVDERTKEALVIDPAMGSRDILKKLSELGCKLRYILNTHYHYDHTADNKPIREESGALIGIHAHDAALLEQNINESLLYMPQIPQPSRADILLKEEDEVSIGRITLEVLHTPGHTAGSACFYSQEEKIVFSGDTLFAGTCGRTDLTGGNSSQMVESLSRLSRLPPEVKVYPGHGVPTTIMEESWIENTPLIKALLRVG